MPPKPERGIVLRAVALNAVHNAKMCIGVLFFMALASCRYGTTGRQGNKKVEIKKVNGRYSFYKDGKPFIVKGVMGHSHVAELASIGGNTMCVWDTASLQQVLEDAAKNNVNVIAGLDLPTGELTSWYKDGEKVAKTYADYKKLVNKYKNHTALLAWALGNELIMPVSPNSSHFFKGYNRFLNMIHEQDPSHPVTTTIINYQKENILNIRWKLRGIDFISINTYNKLKDIRWELRRLEWFWDGPYLVSEWCPNGGWEAQTTVWGAPIENTSTKKAEQYSYFFKAYMPTSEPRFLGSLAFYWGSRHEYTPTWYSVYNENGCPNEIKESLADCWNMAKTKHEAAQVDYMLIDSAGAKDNIILSPGSKHTAYLLIPGWQPKDSLRYSWEIMKEDWFTWGRTWQYFERPRPEHGLIADSTMQNTSFICPKKEGPYRIFVTVYNNKGYCTTANTPFYVVNNEL